MQPYEVIMSPAEVYVALEGEAFPAIDAVPAGNWKLLGTAGSRNQSEAGVKVKSSQTMTLHSTAGSLGPVKGIRTGESQSVECVIEDLTLELLSYALNLNGVTEVAAASGVAGYKQVGLSRGRDVITFSVLVRVPASAYGDGLNTQWEVPKAINTGNPELVFDGQGTAAGVAFMFDTLEDPNASNDKERFGRLKTQTATALP